MAVRLAESLVHPRVFATSEGGLPGEMLFTFLVALAGMALLFATLMRFELAAKATRGQISRACAGRWTPRRPPRRPLASRRPLRRVAADARAAADEAGKYVAGAYVVFVALLLIYVIMAVRIDRMRKQELQELELAESRRCQSPVVRGIRDTAEEERVEVSS